MSNLTLYGTISMSLVIGVLVALIVGALLDRGGDGAYDDSHVRAALADQRRRRAVLGTPTNEHPRVIPARGLGITFDVAQPGRHRALDAALTIPPTQRPSLTTATLNQAVAWLAVDRVKRGGERGGVQQQLNTQPPRPQYPPQHNGRRPRHPLCAHRPRAFPRPTQRALRPDVGRSWPRRPWS